MIQDNYDDSYNKKEEKYNNQTEMFSNSDEIFDSNENSFIDEEDLFTNDTYLEDDEDIEIGSFVDEDIDDEDFLFKNMISDNKSEDEK